MHFYAKHSRKINVELFINRIPVFLRVFGRMLSSRKPSGETYVRFRKKSWLIYYRFQPRLNKPKSGIFTAKLLV